MSGALSDEKPPGPRVPSVRLIRTRAFEKRPGHVNPLTCEDEGAVSSLLLTVKTVAVVGATAEANGKTAATCAADIAAADRDTEAVEMPRNSP
jgi:hypothetical protein